MSDRRAKQPLRKDIYFAQIPEWVLFCEDLSPQAVRLYAVLSRFSEDRRWPGRKLLAERLHVTSVKTVDRALRELEHVHAITIHERYDEAGDRTSNAYEVHVAPPEGVASRMSPPTDTNVPTGRDNGDATGGDTDVPTGGATDVAVERATFRSTPLPPASGGTQPALEQPKCTKPGALPHPNCRSCGTTSRQIQAASTRAAAEQRRTDAIARAHAEREAREAARPPPERTAAHAEQARAQITRSHL